MFFLLVILGAYMGWVESVYSKLDAENTKSRVRRLPDAHDWYAPLPKPLLYLSNKVLEPDDTPEVCDKYVRFVARSRR